MFCKLIRTAIGLPIITVAWVLLLATAPLALPVIYVIAGDFESLDVSDLWLPIKFIKHVWKD